MENDTKDCLTQPFLAPRRPLAILLIRCGVMGCRPQLSFTLLGDPFIVFSFTHTLASFFICRSLSAHCE